MRFSLVPLVLSTSLLSLFLGACAVDGRTPLEKAVAGDGPGNPRAIQTSLHETVRNLPKSRYGNPETYAVLGQRYRVLDSAENFREAGIASWYGKKFHGRKTSSGEVYDMHLLTAAHKHLPVPTFVRVTRRDNGDSIIVKVNDRGPFVEDRIIDLSYAAAARLGMLKSGTAPVHIEALTTHLPDAGMVATAPEPISTPAPTPVSVPSSGEHFIQLGAFSETVNAEQLLGRVEAHVGMPGQILHDRGRSLYRVHLGPVVDRAALESTLSALASHGITDYTMVTVKR